MFSVESAEKLLPVVSNLFSKCLSYSERIAVLMDSEGSVEVCDDSSFHLFVSNSLQVNKEFHRLYYNFYKILGELYRLNVFCDIQQGIVEFPSRLNGRDIFLCWQLGDDRIRFLRELDSEERKPLIDVADFV